MSYISELTLAKNAYVAGNLSLAYNYTRNLLVSFFQPGNIAYCSSETLLEYLDLVSLHQSILILQNKPQEYLYYEPYIKDLTTRIFHENSDFYYAVHCFDACDAMAMHSFLTEAKTYKITACSLLRENYGNIPYLSFMENICDAQIAFSMEDYYQCINAASAANSLWYSPAGEQISMPYCPDKVAAFRAIEQVGIKNILLLCNAYGKINNPNNSIALLENFLSQQAFDYYQTVSAEITLAELYLIAGQTKKASLLYEKYKQSNFLHYPGLTAALSSMAYILEKEPSQFNEVLNSSSFCYSQNMFTISRYNHALGLVSNGNYEKALAEFEMTGNTGYSMRLAILAMQNQSSEIDALRNTVNDYFYRQINQVIAHYDEEIAYNHLAKLQYHIDFTLGAYCHNELNPSKAYDFLLNTKYIALETTFLKKNQKERCIYSSDQVMQRLDDNTILLEYTKLRTITTICYGVFVVSKNNMTYIPLGETASIDMLISEWTQLFREAGLAGGSQASLLLSNLQDIAVKLKKALYFPIKAHIPADTNLLIAPAGSLVNFPFSQLAVSAAKTLGDCHFISYLNTGKELLFPDSASASTFDNVQNAVIISNPATTRFANLPFADKEAGLVASCLPATTYQHNTATLTNIREALSTMPDMLHIAAHGVLHSPPVENREVNWDLLYQSMNNSGIVLADSILSCTHISTLDLSHIKLAVLSCCHSGTATYLGTEGAYGLRRAFLMAGCKALIVSLWQVDDTASFLWMKAFYENLFIAGASLKESYRAAGLTVKNYELHGIHPYANPYYWAGFILISPHK